ncbi:phosphopantetheine-binding protein [Streptomyces sp. NPDC053427]|uniref:phosphopantetheine-binding protein n=1 Tax=Streptomyces sp. NPDC053427 TaxID=3365701 RepID=UPI0037D6E164
MTSIDDFLALIRDELGIPVTADDIGRHFDEIAGWDSVYLLHLLTVLERETGRSISLPDVLASSDLESVYTLATAS